MASGPFNTSSGTFTQIGGIHWNRTSYTGSKRTPHYYAFNHYRVLNSGGFFRPGDCQDGMNFTAASIEAQNKLFVKYRKALDEKASLAVTLAERKKAYDMVKARTLQFARFLNLLRKKDIKGVMRTLGVIQTPAEYRRSTKRTFRTPAKSWSGKVLEWNFGWAPLLGDIHSAYEVLTNLEVLPEELKVRAASTKYSYNNGVTPSRYAFTRIDSTVLIKYQYMSRVRVTDTDQLLMYQLGLTNPWLAAVELIPWSFVVGWFTNLEACLKSLSPIYGLTEIDYFRTRLVYRTRSMSKRDYYDAPLKAGNGVTFNMIRELVKPSGPEFALKPFVGFSPQRGLNAVALVLQRLKGK